jgi:hypothetical protein
VEDFDKPARIANCLTIGVIVGKKKRSFTGTNSYSRQMANSAAATPASQGETRGAVAPLHCGRADAESSNGSTSAVIRAGVRRAAGTASGGREPLPVPSAEPFATNCHKDSEFWWTKPVTGLHFGIR